MNNSDCDITKGERMSLCHTCFNCWGTTTDGYAKCDAYPNNKGKEGISIHEIILVKQRDKCERYKEDDSWGREEAIADEYKIISDCIQRFSTKYNISSDQV